MSSTLQSLRSELKKSRFKIWLRAFLFIQFCIIFGFYLVHDIANSHFRWEGILLTFALFVPVGFLMSRIVPMQANLDVRAVTFSLDRVYLVLIWVLVIAKLILGHFPSLVFFADIIMCSILGIMFGRLGGLGIRVRQLKLKHGFLVQE